MAVKRSNPSAALATDQADASSQTTFPATLKRPSKRPRAQPVSTGDDPTDGSMPTISSSIPQKPIVGRTVPDLVTEQLDDPRVPISVAVIIAFIIKPPAALAWEQFSVPLGISVVFSVVWIALSVWVWYRKPKPTSLPE